MPLPRRPPGLQGHLTWKSTGHPYFQLARLFFNIEVAKDLSTLASCHLPSQSPKYTKLTGSYKKKIWNLFYFSKFFDHIKFKWRVSIWIRIWVHIHIFKSVKVQFHHAPLNVCPYLHIRVEIRPSFVNQGSTLWNKKRWYHFSFKSLNLKELTCLNLDNKLCFYFYCRSKQEQPAFLYR